MATAHEREDDDARRRLDVIASLSLTPWENVLRQLKPLVSASYTTSRVRWLDSKRLLHAAASAETWRRVGEALDVLALMARIDTRLWRREIVRLWPQYAAKWSDPSEFEMGVVVHVPRVDVVHALSERVVNAERPRAYYSRARDHLEVLGSAVGGERPRQSARPKIPVRLEFAAALGNAEVLSRALFQTLQIVMAHRTMDEVMVPVPSSDGTSRLKTRACFEVVEVEFKANVEIDKKGLRYVRKLVERGVVFYSLPCVHVDVNMSQSQAEGHEVTSLVECLQRVVAGVDTGESENRTSTGYGGVHRLTISDSCGADFLLAILSAAQVSKSLHTVHINILQELPIDPGHIDQHLMDLWRCVAYTLLSSDAEHDIVRLELDLDDFRAEYVDAIRAVLCAWRPVTPQALGAGIFDRLLGRQSQQVTCSGVYLFDPRKIDHDAVFFDLPAPMDLRVIDPASDEGATQTVLLPGWGKGWVHGQPKPVRTINDLQLIPASLDAARSFPVIRIASLNVASMPAAATLMSLIGHQVMRFEIGGVTGDAILDGWLSDVLPCFPSLQDLEIMKGRLSSMDALVDVLTASKQDIRMLNLECGLVATDVDQFVRFFEMLSNPQHRVSAHLGELWLKIRTEGDTLLVASAVSDALLKNRRLYGLRLVFDPAPAPNQREAIMRLLSSVIHERPICRVAPLGIRQKLAFVSAVDHRGEDLPRLPPFNSLIASSCPSSSSLQPTARHAVSESLSPAQQCIEYVDFVDGR